MAHAFAANCSTWHVNSRITWENGQVILTRSEIRSDSVLYPVQKILIQTKMETVSTAVVGLLYGILVRPILELRRLHADLFWCYKVGFGLAKVQSDMFFVMNPCSVTRGHKYKLYKRHSDVRVRSSFFSERVLNIWNRLPSHLDLARFHASSALLNVQTLMTLGFRF